MLSSIAIYLWALLSKISTQGIQFFFILILARYLSPEDFGSIGILGIFITIANTLVDSGMSSSLIKEKVITEEDSSTLFTFNVGVSILLYSIIYVCSPYIERYFQIEGLARISRLMALPIVINALSIVPKTMLVKNLKFDILFWVQFISLVVTCGIVVVLVMGYDWRLDALLMYYNLLALFPAVGYWIVTSYMPKFCFSIASLKKLFSFGAYNTLSNIVDSVYENILSVFIGKYMNVAQAGYYSQAKKIEEVPSRSITELICGVSFPQLCKRNTDHLWFIDKAVLIQKILYSLMIPAMLLLIVFSEEIINIAFGKGWEAAAPYLKILSFAGIWIIIENTNRTFIKSLGRADVMFLLSLVKRAVGILLIVAALLLSVDYLLWAYAVSAIIGAFINAYAIAKLIPYSLGRQLKLWVQIAVPALVFYLLCRFIHTTCMDYYSMIFLIGIVALIYLISLQLFGIIIIKTLILSLFTAKRCDK